MIAIHLGYPYFPGLKSTKVFHLSHYSIVGNDVDLYIGVRWRTSHERIIPHIQGSKFWKEILKGWCWTLQIIGIKIEFDQDILIIARWIVIVLDNGGIVMLGIPIAFGNIVAQPIDIVEPLVAAHEMIKGHHVEALQLSVVRIRIEFGIIVHPSIC